MTSTIASHELLEIGIIPLEPIPAGGIAAGEIGYPIIGVKDVRQSRIGNTITSHIAGTQKPLVGYQDLKPMVFSSIYLVNGTDSPNLRDALRRLRFSDAALIFEPESSAALGFGLRCGFPGLLYLEIIRERLGCEFGLSLIVTAPSVVYTVKAEGGEKTRVENPSASLKGKISEVHEPLVDAMILIPMDLTGIVMELC